MNPLWLNLSQVIWVIIFEKLDLLDCIRFGAVCKLFRSISTQIQTHHFSHPLLLQLPQHCNNNSNSPDNDTTTNIFNFKDQTTYQIHLPNLNGKRCCGSAFGYLFVIDFRSSEIFLLNPLSKSKISLPFPDISSIIDIESNGDELLDEYNNVLFLHNATVSRDPAKTTDFIVMAMISPYKKIPVTYKPGDDKWTILPSKVPIDDISYFKGQLYGVSRYGALVSWDLPAMEISFVAPGNHDEPLETLLVDRRYLAISCRGELLKTRRIVFSGRYDDKGELDLDFYRTREFQVYRLEEERKEWTPYSLSGQVMFLGFNSTICLSTVEHPEFQENCIYFTDDFADVFNCDNKNSNDVGVYNVHDRTFKKFTENPPFWTDSCVWVMPNSH